MPMRLTSLSLRDGAPIEEVFAFGVPDEKEHMRLGPNRNPHLKWERAPEGTRSFAIVCLDVDVPNRAEDVNKEGVVLRRGMPRVDFYHWLVADVPVTAHEISAAQDSDGVTKGGKKPAKLVYGVTGANDYTKFLQGSDMQGLYGGYDGPCPPWNDERLHRYVFTVYALDVETLNLPADYTGADLMAAMEGHMLDQASITGTYTLNPVVSY